MAQMAERGGKHPALAGASGQRALLLFAGLLATAALRAGDVPSHPCATIEDDFTRLACFDRAFPRAADATEAFGLSASQRAQSTGEVAPARIAARVQSVTRTRVGQMVVTLDNGQIWQQGNGEPDVRLDVGDTVTIKKAALGSYILSTPAGRSFRVRRLE